MEIIKATYVNKNEVLMLLDEFRTECFRIINPTKNIKFDTAKEHGESIFNEVIENSNCAIFIAKYKNNFVGILTIYKIAQIRRASYCAEIEEMFVVPNLQGKKNIAKQLIDAAIAWAKENNITSIRLESNNYLLRAHSFYEKTGFKHYGKAYELAL